MTDREKLQKAIDILKHYYNAVHDQDLGFDWKVGFKEALWVLKINHDSYGCSYQPSSRPCFDKPAGVAILHGETLCDK